MRIGIRLMPRARVDGVAGVRAGRVVVRVRAAPVDGAANEAMTRLLAGRLGVPPREVRIERGRSSRDKLVSVPAAARTALAALMK